MNRRVELALRRLQVLGSDPEIAADFRAELLGWLERGLGDEEVVKAANRVQHLALIELARGGLRALTSDSVLGWSLIREWVRVGSRAAHATCTWRKGHGVTSTLPASASEICLQWAAARALREHEAEQTLRALLLGGDLRQYSWNSARFQEAPARLCLQLAARVAGTTAPAEAIGPSPYPALEVAGPHAYVRAVLDFHLSEMTRQSVTMAFLSDPYGLIPFEAMVAASEHGVDLHAIDHPLVWFSAPTDWQPTTHTDFFARVTNLLDPAAS